MPNTDNTHSAFYELGSEVNFPLLLGGLTIKDTQPSSMLLVAGRGAVGKFPEVGQVSHLESKSYIFGLAPERWLVVNESVSLSMKEFLSDGYYAADVSSAWSVLRMEGDRAREILQCLCPVDIHPSTFSFECCFQSTIAGNPALVSRPNAAESFKIFIPRSHARGVLENIYEVAHLI